MVQHHNAQTNHLTPICPDFWHSCENTLVVLEPCVFSSEESRNRTLRLKATSLKHTTLILRATLANVKEPTGTIGTKNREVKRGFPPRNDLLFQKPELHHQRLVSYWIIKHLLLVKFAKSAILLVINSDLFLCLCKSSLLCDEQYLCCDKEPCRSQGRHGVPCRG